MWGEQDSNLRRWKPTDLQSVLVGRLSISPHFLTIQSIKELEPMEGLEPTTCWLQISCSSQLSYIGFSYFFRIKKSPLFLTDCKGMDLFNFSKYFLNYFATNMILIFLFAFLTVFLMMQLQYLFLLQRFCIVFLQPNYHLAH